ncbi:tRNA (N6-isopentenyl adenosine(37)-C2)-methylthiotransferase MiaB [Persicobacter psychrovividus]|uniref:tRNA-2-methylthio-N(6)-dimethylallyladenosine synthase n=1 Tax=Persicobacter psychrovividus TaxID=387638 RepID=A0ABM7VEV7_9BACT|nr:tRNA-2-methylthio-N(6)-dimethylallyladenosine synthase [Persicobacter psychrovividus]
MSDIIKDLGVLDNDEQHSQKVDATAVKISQKVNPERTKKMYIESYGCQMNFSDSEIITSIMAENGYGTTDTYKDADVILLNTCSIREKAEKTIRKRLEEFNAVKRTKRDLMVGVLGCMAERLKSQLLEEEKVVDLVVGPDAYRDLPALVSKVEDGQKAVNTILSKEETYADVTPVRLNSNGLTAFISIMRGCDNMCSFCIVPFTRGRERSRDPHSIVAEAKDLFDKGYREVTLLGQNVDSYKWAKDVDTNTKKEINKLGAEEIVNFADLLKMVAAVSPDLRVRFSTSHPKDITDDVLYAMRDHENICNYIHLPAQSGNSRVLDLMNRTYDREWYINRVDAIRSIIGEDCGISSDFITGFCTETEEEHQETLSLMEYVKYDYAYMFFYSERPGTLAAKKFEDDIPLDVKKRRLEEIIAVQNASSLARNKRQVGQVQKVLVEKISKKDENQLSGRNSANKVVVFDKEHYKPGDYVMVKITDCTQGTLLGKAVEA